MSEPMATCEYSGCRAPAVGELQAHNQAKRGPWAMCEKHIRPEAHPPDLRKRLHRWRRRERPAQATSYGGRA